MLSNSVEVEVANSMAPRLVRASPNLSTEGPHYIVIIVIRVEGTKIENKNSVPAVRYFFQTNTKGFVWRSGCSPRAMFGVLGGARGPCWETPGLVTLLSCDHHHNIQHGRFT